MTTQADRLSWLIEAMGLNKSTFAKLLGKHYKQVHGWTGGTPMDPNTLVLVAEKTGVSVSMIAKRLGCARISRAHERTRARSSAREVIERSERRT